MELESSVLAFSINVQDANKEFIYPAIDRFFEASRHQNKFILVCDTLREKSYHVVDKYSKQTARQMCLDTGDEFIKIFEEYFKDKSISRVPVIRWEEVMAEKSYQLLLSNTATEAGKDGRSKELLEAVATEFLKKRNPTKSWKAKHVAVSVDFLLQELPLFFLQFSLKNHRIDEVFYPTSKLQDALGILSQLALVTEAVAGTHPRSKYQCLEISKPACRGIQPAPQPQELQPTVN